MYRVSPRIIFNANKVRLAGEVEYTSAKFGKNHDNKAVPINLNQANNIRALISAYYFF